MEKQERKSKDAPKVTNQNQRSDASPPPDPQETGTVPPRHSPTEEEAPRGRGKVRNRHGRRRQRRRRLLLGTVAVCSLFATAVIWKRDSLAFRFGYWRETVNLEKAQKARDDGDWKAARRYGEAAWQLGHGNPDILRLLLEAYQHDRDGKSIAIARQLAVHADATVEERISALDYLLDVGDRVGCEIVWRALPEKWREARGIRWHRARWLASVDRTAEARALVEELLADHADPRYVRVRLALLLGGRSRVYDREAGPDAYRALVAKDHEEAMTLMDQLLSEKESEDALVAARLLRGVGVFSLGVLAKAVDVLQHHPDATPEDAFLSYDLAAATQPGELNKLADLAITNFREKEMKALCTWLVSKGLGDKVLEILTAEAAAKEPVLYEARVLSLVQAKQFDEALTALDEPPADVLPTQVTILRALATTRRGDADAAKVLWDKAFREARVESLHNHWPTLCRILREEGLDGLSDEAMVAWIKRKASDIPSREGALPALRHLGGKGRDAELLEVMDILAAREPWNQNLANDLAFMQIVNGRYVSQAVQTLEGLVKDKPESIPYRTSLALGYLESGRRAEALDLLETVDWEEAEDADRAILVRALAENGRFDEARETERKINPAALMRTEQKLAYFPGEEAPTEPEAERVKALDRVFTPGQTESGVRSLETLVKFFPRQPVYLASLALAYLASDRPAHAQYVIDEFGVDWSGESTVSAAVRATVYEVNGFDEEAAPLASSLKDPELPERERLFLQRIVSQKPPNPNVLAAEAFQRVLFNRNVVQATRVLARLVRNFPEVSTYRIYLSFAYLATGAFPDSRAAIDSVDLEAEAKLSDRELAVAASILKGLRQPGKSEELKARITDWSTLDRHERELFGAPREPDEAP